jgi:hypothetical protein
MILLGAYLIGFEIIVMSFSVLDWGHGIARGCILFGLLFALILFRIYRQPWRQVASDVPGFVKILLVTAGLSSIGASAYAIQKSLRTHRIELDEGETTWRAARMLWLGQNPYGYRAIVDHAVFLERLEPLAAAGLAPAIPKPEVLPTLEEYDRTLDPDLERRLLPIGSDNEASRPLDANILGYKYGPLVMLATAPFVPLGVPAVVAALNIAACFGLFAAMFCAMREASGQPALAIMGLIALLIDPSIRWNYLLLTATDVWPLLLSSFAVLNFYRGKMKACAIFLALAFGFKIFPSALLLPLLLKSRSPWPIALFAIVVTIIYAPWFLWDPVGILDNVFLWPTLMPKDSTSWLYYAPSEITLIARFAGLAGVAVLWLRYLKGSDTCLFWTLAMINICVLLAGGAFHNNYVPWVSIWIAAALVEGPAQSAQTGDTAWLGAA